MQVLVKLKFEILLTLNYNLKDTESAIKNRLKKLLSKLKGCKFVTSLVLVFKKIESQDKTKFHNFHSSSKAEIIINESEIDDVFESIYSAIISNIQKSLGEGKGSSWIIDSVIDHTIRISEYNLWAGSTYTKLHKELDYPRKGLINIQNGDDNECFKWSIVRYLKPANHHPPRITKAEKDFAKKLDFKNIKLSMKIGDIHKIVKQNSISISVLVHENKEKHPIYVSKKYCEEKHVDLLLIGKQGKR